MQARSLHQLVEESLLSSILVDEIMSGEMISVLMCSFHSGPIHG